MHFNFIQNKEGRILEQSNIFTRISLEAELVQLFQQLLQLELIVSVPNLDDFSKRAHTIAISWVDQDALEFTSKVIRTGVDDGIIGEFQILTIIGTHSILVVGININTIIQKTL